MSKELTKEDFRKAYEDFNPNDEQAVANMIIKWVETNTSPYIPPLILNTMEVPQNIIDKAVTIVEQRIGKERFEKWEQDGL